MSIACQNQTIVSINTLTGAALKPQINFEQLPTFNGQALAVSENVVHTTGDQLIDGNKTFSNNIASNGTDNRLPNQLLNNADNIITRQLADSRYSNTFSRHSDDTVKIQEYFDDFTHPNSDLFTLSNVNANGGSAGDAGFAGRIEGDIWFVANSLVGVDRYAWKGLLGIQTNGNVNSILSIGPKAGLSQYNTDRVTEFSLRFAICKNTSTQFIRFGCAQPFGGQAGANWSASVPALAFDPTQWGDNQLRFIKGATFVSSPFNKGYGTVIPTGIFLEAATWYNLSMKKIYNSNGDCTSMIFAVYNEKNGTTQEYTLTDLSGFNANAHPFDGSPSILLGHTDTGGGTNARKSMMIDWWYVKVEQVKTNTIGVYPTNWEAKRLFKP